ncbi:hypothetical protein SELMODRAFT_415746 [Selaginella moellendorffii]|uniref:Uncharacterized protein n=1 Tax=Selaginella moellendorffii TaxID=88036 RepID=D8RX41_SELML|nr:hypothetical protein SELMODRAFT_415746 [Selaginella moellendorffii]
MKLFRDTPRDEDGKKSDIFVCDKAAYQMLNDAHLRGTELGDWVAKRLCLGALFMHHNYDQVIPEWLKLHGQQDDAECVESAQPLAEAATDTKFVELLRKDFVCLQQLFVEHRAVDKPRDVPFRVWHVTSLNSRKNASMSHSRSSRIRRKAGRA